jgi:hypothetical protein
MEPNENDDNIVQFPQSDQDMKDYLMSKGVSEDESQEIIDDNNKSIDNSDDTEDSVSLIGEDGTITPETLDQLDDMIKNAREMLELMSEDLKATKKEYSITEDQMKKIWAFNNEHCTPKTEDQTEETYNFFNGLDSMTEDDVIGIFGSGHPIIGVDHEQTMDRIKAAADDQFNYVSALKEYRNIEESRSKLIELNEEQHILELEKIANECEDEESKEKMLASVNEYKQAKYLDFLSEPISDTMKKSLIKAWGSKKDIDYRINRASDKLHKIHIPSKVIFELSKFEEKFLDTKYRELNNMICLYFMTKVTYSNYDNYDGKDRRETTAMVIALDNYIRNLIPDSIKERIKTNLQNLLDQLYDDIIATYGTIADRAAKENNQ